MGRAAIGWRRGRRRGHGRGDVLRHQAACEAGTQMRAVGAAHLVGRDHGRAQRARIDGLA
ncbi:hypothetical protein AUC68_01545 [Methyloceanibacter methanicus]|uniref:Uncharacterized protein n=1 Tax=Methyloceanibacter methanicus TaxID=1774968 RepID=A0A1E3W282_9HYPH|nr:hypothetical protein AUC68_01545 [Methyloceanibacter methanicus]